MSSNQSEFQSAQSGGEPHMSTVLLNRSQMAKRRSTRMGLNMPVGLSGQDRQKCSFTMPAKATNLNKHGAAIEVNRQLLVGSIVVVRNQLGNQSSARVVSQFTSCQGVPTYGIEFVEQDETAKKFWGITFPSVENRPMARAAEQAGMSRRKPGIASMQS